MHPSNDPDIAIAQEWLAQLDDWIVTHGLVGYDPFDIKQTPLIRSMQPHYLPRKASTLLCDLFPNAMRNLLRVEKTENPKAYALVAHAKLRLFQMTNDDRYLEEAKSCIQWLLKNTAHTDHGIAWGYPFAVTAKGLHTPANTPVLVVSVIAGQAILLAHHVTGEDRYLDHAAAIADFILNDIPQLPQENNTLCFAYAPTDHRRVHNANLLAAEFLITLEALRDMPHTVEAAQKALAFSLAHQQPDGAWYYGEHAPDEPFEKAILRFIDHHHTGFVLRSLHAIHTADPQESTLQALQQGFTYYRRLYTPIGMPINAYAHYPVDIHACAEAILCPTVLAATISGAKSLPIPTIRWTYRYLRQPTTGAPYYRRYPSFTSPLVCARWGVAWLYRALAEYCFQFARPKPSAPPSAPQSTSATE